MEDGVLLRETGYIFDCLWVVTSNKTCINNVKFVFQIYVDFAKQVIRQIYGKISN